MAENLTEKPKVSFIENDIEYNLISVEDENKLDVAMIDIVDFIKGNDGKGKTDFEKDLLYKSAQEHWKLFATVLRNAKYKFYLNRAQYMFITELLLRKLEYDVNTVFLAIELTNLLGGMKDVKFNNSDQILPFDVDATEITYIYHLIATYKVKGLTKDAYLFSQILRKIGDISKIFNYYDMNSKELATTIKDWVALFDDNVTQDVSDQVAQTTSDVSLNQENGEVVLTEKPTKKTKEKV